MAVNTIHLAGLQIWRISETVEGEAIVVGDRTIVPLANVSFFAVAGECIPAGVFFSRTVPQAIRVESLRGVETLRIEDVTKRTISRMFMFSTLFSLVLRTIIKSRQRGRPVLSEIWRVVPRLLL